MISQGKRPFWRMVRLFGGRLLHGGGDGEADELDISLGLLLSFLALPGGFVSVLLFDKYGSLLRLMRGMREFDSLADSMPDEYFFIVLSMVVTGAVAIWRWTDIFPDRRDYMNLVPLPLRTTDIFFANLTALLLLGALLALDVNALSGLLFPLVVAASQDKFLFFLQFAGVHILCVILASIFAFLSVFATVGCLLAFLPYRVFRFLAPWFRGLISVGLLALLLTCFAVPTQIQQLSQFPNLLIRYVPSTWYIALAQELRGKGNATYASLSHWALISPVILLLIMAITYGLSYRRHFVRIPERGDFDVATKPSILSRSVDWLETKILRGPFQSACGRFVRKTLVRSELHRLALIFFAGLGLILASRALLDAFSGANNAARALLTADALSVPFILIYCLIAGLRFTYQTPVDLGANWIFRVLVDVEEHESRSMAIKLSLFFTAPWIVLAVLAVYCFAVNPVVAILHAAMVWAWAWLLAKVVFQRFRKIPFTCAYPKFQQQGLLNLLVWVLGYSLFAGIVPAMEAWALQAPWRIALFLPVLFGTWYVLRQLQKNEMEIDKRLIFEEMPVTAVETLRIGI